MKKIVISIVVTLLFNLNIYAEPQKTFTIGVGTWAPFIFADTDTINGISIDYIKELTKRMNKKLVIKKIPWARSLKMLREGNLDAVINMVETPERKQYITFTSPPYFKLTTRFYVKKDNKNILEKYEDLYSYTIGMVKDSAYFEPFNSDKNIKKFEGVSEAQILAMLEKDRFKIIIGTDPQADYEISIKNLSSKITQASYKPNNEVNIRVGISKKSPYAQQMEEINKHAQDILDEGLLDTYRAKYIK